MPDDAHAPRPSLPTRAPRNADGWHGLSIRLQLALTPIGWPAWVAERVGIRHRVRTVAHHLPLAAPGTLTRPLRLAFASDFHAGPYTQRRALVDAGAALAAMAPDLLLLGGDFVCLRARDVEPVIDALAGVHAPLGRFAVLGNHDHTSGARAIARALERAGIEVLVNAHRTLPPPFDQVSVVGLDDHMTGHPDAARAFAGAAPLRLLLMHQPSGLLDARDEAFTLALAGHTHGGQITLDAARPLVVPWGPLSRRYHAGEFDVPGRGRLLVSRGVGCSMVPLRLNAPAEVHLCTLSEAAPA